VGNERRTIEHADDEREWRIVHNLARGNPIEQPNWAIEAFLIRVLSAILSGPADA
jgi:hypothetical protein